MTDTLLGPPEKGPSETATPDGDISAEAIGLDFVPRPLASVATRQVGGEAVLLDQGSGTVYRLDAVGSVVWSAFDGSADLGVLVEELADAFGADVEVVGRDTVGLTRTLAEVGLLAGIAPPEAHRHPSEPVGVDVGEELPPFRLPDLDGATVDLADLRGGPVLVVNWAPGCGYCVMIGAELDALRPALAERGVRLLLVAAADEASNRALLDKLKVDLPILLRNGADDGFVDPFPRMGTPAAYLLDADGRVSAPLATGAYQVPGLVRLAAGQATVPAVGADGSPTVRYVPGASEGMCGPTTGKSGSGRAATPRTWTANAAYRVGDHHLGVRADTPEAAELIRRFLAAHHVGDDPNVAANLSVVLGSGVLGSGVLGSGGPDAGGGRRAASRDLKILLHASTTVVRSRSSRRVLLGLASFLGSYLPVPDDGLLRTRGLALVVGGEAVILPPAVLVALEELQPRVARFGARLVDERFVTIDPASRELVVVAPALSLDLAVLDEVAEPPPSRTEPARVAAGRYPLRAWAMWDSGEPDAPELTPAEVLTQGLSALTGPPEALPAGADLLEDLFAALPPVPLSRTVDLSDQLRPYLDNRPPS